MLASLGHHRRYSQVQALEYIANRYRTFQERLLDQVQVLQKDGDFCDYCCEQYDHGIKDWFILLAVLNVNLNHANGLQDRAPKSFEEARRVVAAFQRNALPICKASYYSPDRMEQAFAINYLTVLETWGFEIRMPGVQVPPVKRFLEERMGLLEDDLPHQSLFADPRGDWPEVPKL